MGFDVRRRACRFASSAFDGLPLDPFAVIDVVWPVQDRLMQMSGASCHAFGAIFDLDRPRAGAIVVDQTGLEETVKALASPPFQLTDQRDPATHFSASRS